MKTFWRCIGWLASWGIAGAAIAGEPALIPRPLHAVTVPGEFMLTATTCIRCDRTSLPAAKYLYGFLRRGGVVRVPQETFRFPAGDGALSLRVDSTGRLGAGGYRLQVAPHGIAIVGNDYAGVIGGVHTLLQLLPAAVYTDSARYAGRVPCVEIVDRPRFAYRGMSLDVARAFVPYDRLLRYIERLAWHKIDRLHLHLTDDEGWRMALRSYPALAEVGGFRGGDSPVHAIYGAWNRKYGGYYTREQLRELVAFAAVRGVEVIPEIDLPGHSRAAARVMPEILCRGPVDTARSAGYDRRNVWCAAREENYAILAELFDEVCAIFPSRYIYIGGDEVEPGQWRCCPDCRALMLREGLNGIPALQTYFMARLADTLAVRGRRVAVWNEAIEGGRLPADTRVHGWEGVRECLTAVRKGYRLVAMPSDRFYFDMRQSPSERGMSWAGTVTLDRVYGFNFAAAGFTRQDMGRVEGVEGAFWGELALSADEGVPDYIDYMTYPRICALAEVGWRADSLRDAADFSRRLAAHYERLSAMGIGFRIDPPAVSRNGDELRVVAPMPGAVVRCTEDGSDPVPESPRCADRLPADGADRYRFAAFYGTGRSPVVTESDGRWYTPAVRITTSMPVSERNPLSRIERYAFGTSARTVRTCREGDWIAYAFEQPLACRSVELTTGYGYVPRCIFESGYVEASRDGVRFERLDTLRDGRAVVGPFDGVRILRMVNTGYGNGEAQVAFHAPRIRR